MTKKRTDSFLNILPVALFLALLFISISSAKADTYSLNMNRCGDGCLTPAGAGAVTQSKNKPAVAALDPGYPIERADEIDSQLIKFIMNANRTRLWETEGSVIHDDAAGHLSYGIRCTPCGSGPNLSGRNDSSFTFHVTSAALENPMQADNLGSVLVARNNGNGKTRPTADFFGPVSTIGPSWVPKPSTLFLYGGGLILVGYTLRRKKKSMEQTGEL